MKIDLEKLICSLLNEMLENIGKRRNLKFLDIIEALKEQGLEYNDGKLTLIENEPKFKVGQTIIYKGTENIAPTKMTVSDIAKGQYWDDNCFIVPISDQDNWELEKPSTIKFEPDIDAMVEEYKKGLMNNIYLDTCWHKAYCETYRQGLEDMYKRLKG